MTQQPVSTPDPIPVPVAELLAAFRETLAEVRFPEVDRAALEVLAESVRAHAAEVALARVTLASALEALEDAQGRLAERAELALAYARIYAGSAADATLADRLAVISLGKTPKLERSVPAAAEPRRTRKRGVAQLAETREDVVPQLALDEAAAE